MKTMDKRAIFYFYRKTAVKLPPFKVEDARLKNECPQLLQIVINAMINHGQTGKE